MPGRQLSEAAEKVNDRSARTWDQRGGSQRRGKSSTMSCSGLFNKAVQLASSRIAGDLFIPRILGRLFSQPYTQGGTILVA